MKKVVLITNIPTPYRVPLFNELNSQLSAQGWELTVVFGARTYSRRKFTLDEKDFTFRYLYLDSSPVQLGDDNEKTTFTYKGLVKTLKKEKPDLVITNGFSPATMKVWIQRILGGPRYIIWSGSVNAPGRFDSLPRKLQRKALCAGASAFVSYGSKATEYLENLGSGSKPVYTAINTVDTSFFTAETSRIRNESKQETKKHITFTGYLVKRKGVEKLLECVKMLAERRSDFILDILGDGADKSQLEQWCSQNSIAHLVKFHGFVQKEHLPSFYAQSSLFLFQTDFDIWGLVLNEAMAAGLPVIASPNAGATHDLILNGETGFVADFTDTRQSTQLISDLLDKPAQLAKTGEMAARFIQEKASLYVSAAGFTEAILKTAP